MAFNGFATAAQPNGDKSPHHKVRWTSNIGDIAHKKRPALTEYGAFFVARDQA
jgi:hypothetical protein